MLTFAFSVFSVVCFTLLSALEMSGLPSSCHSLGAAHVVVPTYPWIQSTLGGESLHLESHCPLSFHPGQYFMFFWPAFWRRRTHRSVTGSLVIQSLQLYWYLWHWPKPWASYTSAGLTYFSNGAILSGILFSLSCASQSIQYVCAKLNLIVNMLKVYSHEALLN